MWPRPVNCAFEGIPSGNISLQWRVGPFPSKAPAVDGFGAVEQSAGGNRRYTQRSRSRTCSSQNGKQHVTEGRTIVQTRPPRHAPLRAAVEALAVWGPSELYLPR